MKSVRLITVLVTLPLIIALVPAAALAKGPPTGGETTNNLSFPVIWADGQMTIPGTGPLTASLTVPYTTVNPCGPNQLPFAQKTVGNVWQAENVAATAPVTISEIDWGDSLESVDMKVGRPVRVELTLYKTNLATPMTGYTMVMLANPSSSDEVQGVCAAYDPVNPPPAGDYGPGIATYASTEATVYSNKAKLLIQRIEGFSNLTWNGTQWTSIDASGNVLIPPVSPVNFTAELNVGGKVIYGLSTGGWKPTETGAYRITFYLPTASNDGKLLFDASTIIRPQAPEEEVTVTAGGTSAIDVQNNLTYIDISVVAGGGGRR